MSAPFLLPVHVTDVGVLLAADVELITTLPEAITKERAHIALAVNSYPYAIQLAAAFKSMYEGAKTGTAISAADLLGDTFSAAAEAADAITAKRVSTSQSELALLGQVAHWLAANSFDEGGQQESADDLMRRISEVCAE